MSGAALRVGLIGPGSIGTVVHQALAAGEVAGCRLSGVIGRSDGPEALDQLVAESDVIVEAAGQEVLRTRGPAVTDAGCALLVLSVGALVDDSLLERLRNGAGRVLVSTGAVGGLDWLRAARLGGGLQQVDLRTTKTPSAVVQPWMDADVREQLLAAADPITAFRGPATDAVKLFPASVNVAATLALATVGFDALDVEVVADPAASLVEHRIAARGELGSIEVTIRNVASPHNPRTSAITPYAALRALDDLGAGLVVGV